MKEMNEKNEIVVVAGADGFIGGSLVADLRRQGYTRIRAVGARLGTSITMVIWTFLFST